MSATLTVIPGACAYIDYGDGTRFYPDASNPQWGMVTFAQTGHVTVYSPNGRTQHCGRGCGDAHRGPS